jgi:Kdo2-lipid IVA lauroyltransferase/acyltransferase
LRERLEYALVWPFVKVMGLLPRSLARALGISLGLLVNAVHGRLRRVGLRNLTLAFPDIPDRERRRILRGVYVSLGRQLAEVCLFPRYTRASVSRIVTYDGFENFERAYARGKGVLFLTAHLGAWELSAFAHSLNGHPLSIVMRSLDNPYIDRLIQSYRTMHGNRTVDKDDFVRGLLAAMRKGETVGILMDTNMTPPQGVFVDFFGIPACTASGLARIALRTDAAVVPGFTVWDATLRRYILRFDPAVELIRTGATTADSDQGMDDRGASDQSHNADRHFSDADIVANTARFTAVLEKFIRQYPDQWLWVHRRWKTRPAGQPSLYDSRAV